jgi:hypothetical protein
MEAEEARKIRNKKAGTISGPGLVLAGCPDKLGVSFEFQVRVTRKV